MTDGLKQKNPPYTLTHVPEGQRFGVAHSSVSRIRTQHTYAVTTHTSFLHKFLDKTSVLELIIGILSILRITVQQTPHLNSGLYRSDLYVHSPGRLNS